MMKYTMYSCRWSQSQKVVLNFFLHLNKHITAPLPHSHHSPNIINKNHLIIHKISSCDQTTTTKTTTTIEINILITIKRYSYIYYIRVYFGLLVVFYFYKY